MNETQITIISEYYKKDGLNDSDVTSKIEDIKKDNILIDKKWESIIKSIIESKTRIKLIIWAEAPLSKEKYFYNSPNTFLSALKTHYNNNCKPIPALTNKNFIIFLNKRGVLLIDLFKYPLPSELYKSHRSAFLDIDYIKNKLELIKDHIDEKTVFTYRYKMLRDINIFQKNPELIKFDKHFIKDKNNKIQTIFESERPQVINELMESAL
jgi:hypothetical protein